jgi:O-succinylbenzoate synthase
VEPAPIADGLSRAWADIGSAGTPTLEAIDLWLVELGFAQPVQTARGVHRSRPVVVVRLRGHDGSRAVEGWGEGAALADATYDPEDAARSWIALEDSLIPALIELVARDGGRLAGPSGLEVVRRAAPTSPLSFAALEMAVADLHLRAERRTLAAVLGVEGRPVPVGAVAGRIEPIRDLVAEVGRLRDLGFARVKLKIGPGWDIGPLDAVRRSAPDLALQVDANGSYSGADLDHLVALDRFDLLCLEQPFDRADLDTHRLLAQRTSTPICLDESIDSPASARRALEMGACSVICVKPSRLGGLGATLDLVEWCTLAGVPLWMGGMFESGYARGVNTAVAALPGFAWPGDLSPARSYLRHDLVRPTSTNEPERIGRHHLLSARPPLSGGLGGPPDLGILERYGVQHRTFGPDRG